jgi:hypothetical protein
MSLAIGPDIARTTRSPVLGFDVLVLAVDT